MSEVPNNLSSVRKQSPKILLHGGGACPGKNKNGAAVFPEQEEYGVGELTEPTSSSQSISKGIGSPFPAEISFSSWFLENIPSQVIYQEGLKHVLTWLVNPTRNKGLEELSVTYAEKSESCYAQFHYKDSSCCNNFSGAFNTGDVSSSWMWDIDRNGFCGSFLEKQKGWDDFPSDFPSPTYMKSSDSNENLLEDDMVQDIDKNEPLFWPSESKFCWNSSAVMFDSFSVSPRRSLNEITNSERFCAPNAVILRLHSRKFQKSSPKAKMPGLNSRVDSRRSKPSKLSISSEASVQQSSPEIKESCEEPTRRETSQDELNADLLEACFLSTSDVAIESLVGLNEFDGQEGLGFRDDFKEENLFLDEPFSENLEE